MQDQNYNLIDLTETW